MSGDALARHYGALTADERFRLVVEARARGDAVDEDRLVAACPKYRYRLNDAAFVHRWTTAEQLVMAFVGDTGRFFGWLEVLSLLRGSVADLIDEVLAVTRAHDAAEHADDEDDDGDDGDDAQAIRDEDMDAPADAGENGYPVVAMEAAHNVALAMVHARWEAFRACCAEELGIEAETLLRALWPQVLERIQALPAEAGAGLRRLDQITAVREEWRATAREVWRKGTGESP